MNNFIHEKIKKRNMMRPTGDSLIKLYRPAYNLSVTYGGGRHKDCLIIDLLVKRCHVDYAKPVNNVAECLTMSDRRIFDKIMYMKKAKFITIQKETYE